MPSINRTPSPPTHLIFTDLDGTLLDHRTYDWKEALPALGRCREMGVPVILASSKTRAEMNALRSELNLSDPFVSENGGGVFFPAETFKEAPNSASPSKTEGKHNAVRLWEWSLGTSYIHLVRSLRDIRSVLGWSLKGFSEMDIDEIARLTGLDREAARLAAMREYDEPFIFLGQEPKDLKPLYKEAAAKGLTVVSGGRFYHLLGNNDKGKALARISSWYDRQFSFDSQTGHIPTVALGDSPNDFSMLIRADFPVLIRSERDFPELMEKVPKLKITQYKGPKGWNAAILDILETNKETAHA